MIGALAAIAALVAGGRIAYPLFLERRVRSRHPLGPDGIIVGASGPLA